MPSNKVFYAQQLDNELLQEDKQFILNEKSKDAAENTLSIEENMEIVLMQNNVRTAAEAREVLVSQFGESETIDSVIHGMFGRPIAVEA